MIDLIENKLKYNKKVVEYERNNNSDDQDLESNEPKQGLNPQQVNENMKMAFAIMDMGKIKTMEKIKTEHKDDFRLEDLKKYSEKVAQELLDNVYKANQGEKKSNNKGTKKLKLGE